MPDFPAGLPDIPNAVGSNPLSIMHTSESHSIATNRIVANLLALATKIGTGAGGPPGTAAVLRRTATGASGWGAIQSGDIGTGVAPRTATLVVAASNASQKAKDTADYVCDGTNDHVEINAAFAALPASGGTVQLSEGSFNIAASVGPAKANSVLAGAGRTATSIVCAAAINNVLVYVNYTNCEVRDLTIDGVKGTYTNPAISGLHFVQSSCRAINVYVVSVAGRGITTAAHGQKWLGCSVALAGGISYAFEHAASVETVAINCSAYNGVSHGFYVGGPSTLLLGCDTYQCQQVGLYLANTATNSNLVGCHVHQSTSVGIQCEAPDASIKDCVATNGSSNGIYVAASGLRASIAGCVARSNSGIGIYSLGPSATIAGCYAYANGSHGILTSAANSQITGCRALSNALSGIQVDTGPSQAVVGNMAIENGQVGIAVAGVVNATIVGNLGHSNSTSSHNGHDNILVTGSADHAFITGNTVRQGANPNRPRYGILVFGSTNVFVGTNDTHDGGAAGGLSDQGTNTRRVVKVLLDTMSSADITAGGAISANTWVPIGAGWTFTVQSASSVIMIIPHVSFQIITNTANALYGGRFLFDGGVGSYMQAYAVCQVAGQVTPMVMGTSIVLQNLAIGSHTLHPQVWGNVAATMNCRPASVGAMEFYGVTVLEMSR